MSQKKNQNTQLLDESNPGNLSDTELNERIRSANEQIDQGKKTVGAVGAVTAAGVAAAAAVATFVAATVAQVNEALKAAGAHSTSIEIDNMTKRNLDFIKPSYFYSGQTSSIYEPPQIPSMTKGAYGVQQVSGTGPNLYGVSGISLYSFSPSYLMVVLFNNPYRGIASKAQPLAGCYFTPRLPENDFTVVGFWTENYRTYAENLYNAAFYRTKFNSTTQYHDVTLTSSINHEDVTYTASASIGSAPQSQMLVQIWEDDFNYEQWAENHRRT